MFLGCVLGLRCSFFTCLAFTPMRIVVTLYIVPHLGSSGDLPDGQRWAPDYFVRGFVQAGKASGKDYANASLCCGCRTD